MTKPLNDDRVWAAFYRDNKTVEQIAAEFGYKLEAIEGVRSILQQFTETFQRFHDITARERAVLVNTIDGLHHRLIEQDKTLINLAAALDAVTERKRAERAAKRKEEAKKLRVGRNRNYWQSVTLGFQRGLWMAPSVLVGSLREPLLGTIFMGATLIFRLVQFLLGIVGIPILGLLGLISPPPKIAE